MNYFILQSLALLAAAYFLGALIGCWLRKLFRKRPGVLVEHPGMTTAATATVAAGAAATRLTPASEREASVEISRHETQLPELGDVDTAHQDMMLPPVETPELRASDFADSRGGLDEVTVPTIDLPEAAVELPKVAVPEVLVPEFRLPDVDLPRVDLPEVAMPEIAMAELPEAQIDVPHVDVSNFELPQLAVPEIRLPDVDLPPVELPEVTVPELQVPEIAMPEISVPEITVPEIEVAEVHKTVMAHGEAALGGIDLPVLEGNGIDDAAKAAVAAVATGAVAELTGAADMVETVTGAADDLTRIVGIGAPTAMALNKLGITRFEQIASWSQDDIAGISDKLGFSGRIERENWPDQARILAAGNELEFTTHQIDEIESKASAADAPPVAVAAAAGSLGTVGKVAAAGVARDDLKRIKGVGTNIEAELNSIGITRFEQIAQWSPADIAAVSQKLGILGRIEREKWVHQARLLANRVI